MHTRLTPANSRRTTTVATHSAQRSRISFVPEVTTTLFAMALLLRNIYHATNEWFEESRDIRLADWPLVGSPWPTLAIIAAYMYVCTSLGPTLMRARQPFEISSIISVYNALQIVWNAFVAGFIIYATVWQSDFSFNCQPISYASTARHMLVPVATYMYYIAKIVDLLDTVFFILRKKNGHVSFLHIYHHSMMVVAMYVAVNFVPGGHSWLLASINSLVHVAMYAYYLLASARPQLATLHDWKRLVTQIQLAQFVVLAGHYAYGAARSDCGGYPRPALLIGVIQNGFMFLMFAEFYRKSYASKASPSWSSLLKALVQYIKHLFQSRSNTEN